jgi:hypothetical protein
MLSFGLITTFIWRKLLTTEFTAGSKNTDMSTPQDANSANPVLEQYAMNPPDKLPIILLDAHTCIQQVVLFLRERKVEVDDITEAAKSVATAIVRSVLNYNYQTSYIQTQPKTDADFDTAVDTLSYFGIDEQDAQKLCLQLTASVTELVSIYFPGDVDEALITRSFEVSYTNHDTTFYVYQEAKDVGYNSVYRQNPTGL